MAAGCLLQHRRVYLHTLARQPCRVRRLALLSTCISCVHVTSLNLPYRYYGECHAVVFCVDASDRGRLEEAKLALDRALGALCCVAMCCLLGEGHEPAGLPS